ncbi:MAG: TadE/TadG family type IV pilus assembly protein [Victivallaceae bacterium]
MKRSHKIGKRARQRGSAMVEGLFGVLFLLFVLFAMMQIFIWVGRQMALDYAAFYGAKGLSLGYAGEITHKAARVAAMGVSGRDISTTNRVPLTQTSLTSLRNQAERYMRMGEGSGVNYEFWQYDFGERGYLEFSHSPFTENTRFTARIEHAPLLVPALERVMSISASASGRVTAPEPTGEVRMYNYAKRLLDED